MQAEILAVGSELLGPSRLDTNSLFLTRALAAIGIRVVRKSVLPDDVEALSGAIGAALERSPLVICCGGLGPTCDDCTREAAARALHCALVRDPAQVAQLEAFFLSRGRPMPVNNLQQADRLEPAVWLPNALGTAPGQWVQSPSAMLALLPGPPRELEPLVEAALLPRLRSLVRGDCFATAVLSIVGLPESEVDTIAAPVYRLYPDISTTILSTAGPKIELHFLAHAPDPVAAQVAASSVSDQIAGLLGDAVFSRKSEPLADVVGELLQTKKQSLALAESCTGGLVAERLTRRPGASAYFLGGVVCYSNQSKVRLLGVRAATLEAFGAVSEECACEMATGARTRLGANWGVSLTGIAGPDGGTPEKPVGTVWIGLAAPDETVAARRLQLHGNRERIRHVSAQMALNWLRLRL